MGETGSTLLWTPSGEILVEGDTHVPSLLAIRRLKSEVSAEDPRCPGLSVRPCAGPRRGSHLASFNAPASPTALAALALVVVVEDLSDRASGFAVELGEVAGGGLD